MNKQLSPPFRFGIVEPGIYRGGYPKQRNLGFLKKLGIKTVISLVPEPIDIGMEQHLFIKTDKPKEGVIPLSYLKIDQFLQYVCKPTNAPIYIHCLDGALVTTLAIMCLRRLQCWSFFGCLQEGSRFLLEISPEEVEFVKKYTFESELPLDLSGWLWIDKVPRKPKSPGIEKEAVEPKESRTLEALDLDLGY